MGLLLLLQQDLRNLSNEARKKFPEIKDAAERAEMHLRALEDQYQDHAQFDSGYIKAVAQSGTLVKPFLKAIETRNTKLVILAIGGLQKIILRGAISPDAVPSIVRGISQHLDSADENILLKILQTIVTLLTSNIEIHGEPLAMAMGMCINLYNHKNSTVRNTAGASLRQAAIMLLDHAAVELKNHSSANRDIEQLSIPEDDLNSEHPNLALEDLYTNDAFQFLQDICALTGGDQPTWLRVTGFSSAFGMELLESVLTSHSEFFKDSQKFFDLLRYKMCPLAVKSFKQSQTFSMVLRLLRLLDCIVVNFAKLLRAESEVFLCRLIRMLKPENPLWIDYLVLEIFGNYFTKPELVCIFYENYDKLDQQDSESKVLKNITNSICQFVQYLTGDFAKSDPNATAQLKGKPQPTRQFHMIEMLSANEPPPLDLSMLRMLSGSVLINLIESLNQLTESQSMILGFNSVPVNTARIDPDRVQVIQSICEICWKPVQQALTLLFNKTTFDFQIESILKAFQSFIMICCVLDLEKPRDEYILAITSSAFPKGGDINQITSKVVAGMNALLLITRRYGDILNTGWKLVLENVYELSCLLNSSQLQQLVQLHQNALPSQTPRIAINVDGLGTLVSALSSLFDESFKLNDKSLIFLLNGLCILDQETFLNLANSGTLTSNKSFSLEHIQKITLQNLHRIEVLWDAIFDHLKITIQHSSPMVRACGVETFSQIVITAFAFHSRGSENSNKSDLKANEPDLETQIYIQSRLLEALEELSRSQYNDIRQKTLEALNQILQSSGQVISKGWPLILSILMTVAVNNDKPHILYAFNSVNLICTDFLPNLPLDCLALFITTVGCYGLQSSEINVSLTGIGLLYSIADFLRKDGQLITSDSYAALEKIWVSLFTEMDQLCVDQRFEVRNCSLITLVKTVISHGESWASSTWQKLIWDIYFPLLEKIRSGASAAATEELNVELGTQGGRSVKLLVHHSRNSGQKQWNETVMLCFNGLTRVIKAFVNVLLDLSSFDDMWTKVILLGEQLAVCNSKEIAESVIGNLKELLVLTTSNSKFQQLHWNCVWASLTRIAENYADSSPAPADTTLSCLSTAILQLYSQQRTNFSSEDVKRAFNIMRLLGTVGTSTNPNVLSQVQKDVLELYSGLLPLSDELHEAALHTLASILAKITGLQIPSKNKLSSEDPQLHLLFAERCVQSLTKLFEEASKPVQAHSLAEIIDVLGAVMGLKYVNFSSSIWRNGVKHFTQIVHAGLPTLPGNCSDEQITICWETLEQVLRTFLVSERDTGSLSIDDRKLSESFDLILVQCIKNSVLPNPNKDLAVHKKLIQLLKLGCQQGNALRESFALECYTSLFAVSGCFEGEWGMELAQLAAPVLMSQCTNVLKQFIEIELKSGRLPLAQNALNEVVFVLSNLQELSLHPSLKLVQDDKLPSAYGSSKKRHLLYLFPLLCECITTKEASVKPLLKSIFHSTATEVGLE